MTTQSVAQLFDLTGKVALVTGGGSGIGRAIALRLSEAGAAVTLTDINQAVAQQVSETIQATGKRALAVEADASRAEEATRVVQVTLDTLGGLDILVNNAGIYPLTPALDIHEALWDQVLSLNLKGMFFYAQTAARQMIQAEAGGSIINLASIDAFHPTGMQVHYTTSKGGVIMLTKALALELAPQRIRVNAIAPGFIQTPGVHERAKTLARVEGSEPADRREGVLARVPLGRLGTPDDIASAALFLASAASDYMTGSTLLVDGGYLLS
jgi:2-deoxy-D-gluconate 3-dehydrogenase